MNSSQSICITYIYRRTDPILVFPSTSEKFINLGYIKTATVIQIRHRIVSQLIAEIWKWEINAWLLWCAVAPYLYTCVFIVQVACCAQHSFLDPFWRPLEGSSFPLFSWLISPPWSQTSTQQEGSVSQLSQLTKLSHWLTLSTKDITTSFWHYKKWFCFLSNQIMGLYHFSNPTE